MKPIKLKNMLFFSFLAIILLLNPISCKKNTTNNQNKNEIILTDMTGQEISISIPVKKIVALTPSDCEILYAIGAENTLVGRGQYCNFPSEIVKISPLQSGNEINMEEIIALKPDLVIIGIMGHRKEQTATLEKAGIKVFATKGENIDDVYSSIKLLGKITGKEKNAKQIIEKMKIDFSNIAEKSNLQNNNQNQPKKTIYFEVSPLEHGLWAAGSGTFIDMIAQLNGVTNIFSDVKGWAQVSQEEIIHRNPSFIVIIAMYSEDSKKTEDEILSRKGWQNIDAVKNKAIFCADSDILSRPGPRLTEGAKTLHSFIYKK